MKVYNKIATFLRWFMLIFIIYQVATSTAGMWIALIIGFFYSPVRSPAVYLCCLPILYGVYFHYAAFNSDYLRTHYKL